MKLSLLAKRAWINTLFDYYGGLLTQRQQSIITWYYGDDLSLSEIALSLGISRTAVSDALKQSVEKMMLVDEQLHLIETEQKLIAWIQSLAVPLDEKKKMISELSLRLKRRRK